MLIFQSTLPRREWLCADAVTIPGNDYFNPHSREGSDQMTLWTGSSPWNFNPHSREGSDGQCRSYAKRTCNFNPHSREGSDSTMCWAKSSKNHFNPHSREGSDHPSFSHHYSNHISIHTPAKGVTSIRIDFGDGTAISIHTPAKGVTDPIIQKFHREQRFQSTLPRREWLDNGHKKSVHYWFQSTLPRREWPCVHQVCGFEIRFQSTLPRREWQNRQ